MTKINKSNNGENLRPFCPTCRRLMNEIDLGGEVHYFCSCGEYLEPNFINTIVEDDSFENMEKFASKYGFTFPYLIDETQETAKAYGAICTPDLYAFNAKGLLQYRGRLDSSNNAKKDENTIEEFLNAALQIAKTGTCTTRQIPSMGCSIKWRT